ncbi:GntR family transcriptional regulator [uncultured Metabacillus sp.]|uniref:GntR family transcriptional regulator n=1 Tax=uncultured Metabacillus sp. TaxID=2860135 RepID=UPI002615245D|nr:GntR family transcriptional regulator [uncultured Metabacillus sp.]
MRLKEDMPCHLEISEYLIQKIQSGVFRENQKIPSENELCQQFNVNRHVIRQALARLTNLGWITPFQGKGCYVNSVQKPIQYVLSSRTRFTDNMENLGLVYQSRLLTWEKGLPSDVEQKNLFLSENQTIYRLEILRFIEGQPISITTTVMPEEEVPQLEQYLQNFKSLYRILSDYYQLRPVRSKSIFQALLPILKDAKVLEIPESVPIIQMESIMNHPSGNPIEYSVARIRGDMHKCLVEF